MSAIFDFSSLLTVLLLLICTCAYLRELRPTIFDAAPQQQNQQQQAPQSIRVENTKQPRRDGVLGFLWKLSRIGERLSPYIGAACAIMAIHVIFFQ